MDYAVLTAVKGNKRGIYNFTCASVCQFEILISKLFTIDRFSTSPITSCEIATLKTFPTSSTLVHMYLTENAPHVAHLSPKMKA